jgi:hypothetical protein
MHQERWKRLHGHGRGNGVRKQQQQPQQQRDDELNYAKAMEKFPPIVRNPHAANRTANHKLRYTVWTQVVHERRDAECEVGRKFDSSFATLQDANLRVEYVFHCEAPVTGNGVAANNRLNTRAGHCFRYMKSKPDRSRCLTVCVFPSRIFDALQAEHKEICFYQERAQQLLRSPVVHKEDHEYPSQSWGSQHE